MDRVYELVMGEIKRKRAQRDFMRSEGLDRYSEMYEEVAVALQTVLFQIARVRGAEKC